MLFFCCNFFNSCSNIFNWNKYQTKKYSLWLEERVRADMIPFRTCVPGCVCGGFFSGLLVNLGRKRTLLLTMSPFALVWLVIMFATEVRLGLDCYNVCHDGDADSCWSSCARYLCDAGFDSSSCTLPMLRLDMASHHVRYRCVAGSGWSSC